MGKRSSSSTLLISTVVTTVSTSSSREPRGDLLPQVSRTSNPLSIMTRTFANQPCYPRPVVPWHHGTIVPHAPKALSIPLHS